MYICDYWLYIYTMVQVLIESLPVSSSGHVLLVQKMLGCSLPHDFVHAYDYVLHGPTLLVLVLYFLPRIYRYEKKTRYFGQNFVLLLFLVGIATVCTVVLWAVLHYWLPDVSFWMPYGFLVTTALLGSLYYMPQQKKCVWRYGYSIFVAVLLGCVQGISLLPGISRLASTYVAGRWLGFSGKQAFYCSCALQVPLCAAGFIKGIIGLLVCDCTHVPVMYWLLVLCFFVATFGAYMLLWLLEKLIEKDWLWRLFFYELLVTVFAFFIL